MNEINLVIKLAQLPDEMPAIVTIRQAVFQVEQGVSAALEFDGLDETSDHILAYTDGEAIGTTRIRYLDSTTAKIERVAVLASFRSRGIGRTMMTAALQVLASKNISVAKLHAQIYAKDFYGRLGFQPVGNPFDEAGIPHIAMIRMCLD